MRILWRRLGGGGARLTRAQEAGRAGEEAARRFLVERRGCSVVARNWRSGRDEIDLVVRDGPVLVFVEVKARPAHALVPGFYAVNRRKRRALRRAINAYLAELAEKPLAVRLDVVQVDWRPAGPPDVLHFENIRF